MSRSYKKNPICNDSHVKSTKESKRCANSKVRNSKGLYKGKSYKKLFQSWDIRDFSFRETWKEAKEEYEKNFDFYKEYYPTLKDFYRHWLKCYKRK